MVNLIGLGGLEFTVSYIAPFIVTKNPRISFFIAMINVLLIIIIAQVFDIGRLL